MQKKANTNDEQNPQEIEKSSSNNEHNSQEIEPSNTNDEHNSQNLNDKEDFFGEEEAEFNDDDDEAEAEIEFNDEIGFDDDDENDSNNAKLLKDVNFCKAYYIDFEFDIMENNSISIKVPTTILPISVSVVNGFYESPYLIECKMEFNQANFYGTIPEQYTFINERYGTKFPGSVLLQNRFRNFFKLNYEPQRNYKCQNYLLAPQITIDQSKIEAGIECLIEEGFPEKRAKKALSFCSYDVDKARDFLVSGIIKQREFPIPVNYTECPLFYLILEICEAFFDMEDCCCVCGKKLGVFNLKPACCNKNFCRFSFLDIGVGSNIIGEIKRDPIATDFIITLAGAAFMAPEKPPVLDPSPKSQNINLDRSFFEKLPPMDRICFLCQTDNDLKKLIGKNNFDILRFFILANKAQLITLKKETKTSIDVDGFQFLVTSVSPESELIFREKKEKFGVKWLWHGSDTTRWYRILHTGLKDMGRTEYELNGGPWFGNGIYMSDSFQYSLSYCRSAENIYAHSILPKTLYVISLVENADVKELTGPVAQNEYTQKDDSACITRVLFVTKDNNNRFGSDFNVLKCPPTVPTLQEVLSHQIKEYI